MIAIPAIAEKGYMDVRVSVSTPGGHSSVPPPHTVSHYVFWLVLPDTFYRASASLHVSLSSLRQIRSSLTLSVELLSTVQSNAQQNTGRISRHTFAPLSRPRSIQTGPCVNWRRH